MDNHSLTPDTEATTINDSIQSKIAKRKRNYIIIKFVLIFLRVSAYIPYATIYKSQDEIRKSVVSKLDS
jgi:hypothetical protein